MQRYIFLDLDDTLFQTLRKCGAETDSAALAVRAFLPDGTANSFATRKQQWLWQWFTQGFKIVPVTARDAAALARVTLPFHEEIVLNHGAVILDSQRRIDTVWQERLLFELPPYRQKLLQLWDSVEQYCAAHAGYKPRLVEDFGIVWYGVIKHHERDDAETWLKVMLEDLLLPNPDIADGSLYWHLNGNNLAVLPRIVNKESAVAYLLHGYRQRHADVLTFGAGDSKSDAPFLALCDYALIPNNTQLFNAWVGS